VAATLSNRLCSEDHAEVIVDYFAVLANHEVIIFLATTSIVLLPRPSTKKSADSNHRAIFTMSLCLKSLIKFSFSAACGQTITQPWRQAFIASGLGYPVNMLSWLL
jgi:hypothetical protein